MLHPGSRQLFRYWETIRAERAFPNREDIDFSALKAVLPDLVVVERDHLRKSFRFRLAGSRVCSLFCSNLTSKDVFSGWDSFETEVLRRHIELAISQYQPAVIRMRLTTDRQQQLAAEMVVLPVQVKDSERLQLIGGVFAFRAVNTLGYERIVSRELASARMIWTEHHGLTAARHPSPADTPARTLPRQFRLIEGGLSTSK